MKKEVTIVMLASNEKPALFKHISESGVGIHEDLYLDDIQKTNMYTEITGQHLYFVSDDSIREDDWYFIEMEKQGKIILQHKKGSLIAGAKKVIATTNPKLINSTGTMMYKSDECDLPQPSEEFIKQYCDNNGIDKVMVEYESINNSHRIDEYSHSSFFKLKINPDNTINISLINKSWDREEVIELCKSAFNSGLAEGQSCCAGPINDQTKDEFDWINENL